MVAVVGSQLPIPLRDPLHSTLLALPDTVEQGLLSPSEWERSLFSPWARPKLESLFHLAPSPLTTGIQVSNRLDTGEDEFEEVPVAAAAHSDGGGNGVSG